MGSDNKNSSKCLVCNYPFSIGTEGAVTDSGRVICGRCCNRMLLNGEARKLLNLIHTNGKSKDKEKLDMEYTVGMKFKLIEMPPTWDDDTYTEDITAEISAVFGYGDRFNVAFSDGVIVSYTRETLDDYIEQGYVIPLKPKRRSNLKI